jgi:hypothetical protein
MIKKVSKAIAAQVEKPKGIELAAFRFMADGNGETHFTIDEGRWLRDALDNLLTSGEQVDGPISFDHSLFAYVHERAITRGEFHQNAERLLMEYGLHKERTILQ